MRKLLSDSFAVTAEITPPVSGSANALFALTDPLKDCVDAIVVTEGPISRSIMSTLASSALLVSQGIEPVFQLSCRDRNRSALIADLLGAAAQGIHNILILRGETPGGGEPLLANPVFDTESHELIRMAAKMTGDGVLPISAMKMTSSGVESLSRSIESPPHFFIGATESVDLEQIEHLTRKIEAGAQFIQTRMCFDVTAIKLYVEFLDHRGLLDRSFVLVGVGVLSSANSALWVRDHMPRVLVPDAVIKRLELAQDATEEGINISSEIVQQLK
ncbi:methylenetetrahydrofolate reductase, partial [Pseudomonadota bacterium]